MRSSCAEKVLPVKTCFMWRKGASYEEKVLHAKRMCFMWREGASCGEKVSSREDELPNARDMPNDLWAGWTCICKFFNRGPLQTTAGAITMSTRLRHWCSLTQHRCRCLDIVTKGLHWSEHFWMINTFSSEHQ